MERKKDFVGRCIIKYIRWAGVYYVCEVGVFEREGGVYDDVCHEVAAFARKYFHLHHHSQP